MASTHNNRGCGTPLKRAFFLFSFGAELPITYPYALGTSWRRGSKKISACRPQSLDCECAELILMM